MYIYDFINSKTISDYCRSIGAKWDVFETAVIIARSAYRTLAEKHAAFKDLLKNCPDMEINHGKDWRDIKSVHAKIRTVIDNENEFIEKFKMQDDGWLYKVSINRKNEDDLFDGVFKNYEDALSDAINNNRLLSDDRIQITKFQNNKRLEELPSPDEYIEVTFDNLRNIYKVFPSIKEYKDRDDDNLCAQTAFDSVVYIPVPFKRGDIIQLRNGSAGFLPDKFVLLNTVYDNRENFDKMRYIDSGYMWDMRAFGYFVSCAGIMFWEETHCLDYMEYFNGELSGNDRLLHYISLFLNKKIDYPEFLAMQLKFACECILKGDKKYQWIRMCFW